MQEPEIKISNEELIYQSRIYMIKTLKVQSRSKILIFVKVQTGQYRQMKQYLQVFLKEPILYLKIIQLQVKIEQIFKRVELKKQQKNTIRVDLKNNQYFCIQYKVLNKINSQNSSKILFFKMLNHESYQQFLEFRKKVKKLQNLTSNLTYNISHRIKLQQIYTPQSYISLPLTKQSPSIYLNTQYKLKITLEQVASLYSQNYMVYSLSQSIINIEQIKDKTSKINFTYSQYLKLNFIIENIVVQQKQIEGIVSIRVLETNLDVKKIEVGINNEYNISKIEKINTAKEKNYFDTQYYYLQKNIEQINQKVIENDIDQYCTTLDNIHRLTKAFPNYPHFKNQILLPVKSSTIINFNFQKDQCQQKFEFALYNFLEGLNIIQTFPNVTRIYVQFLKQDKNKSQQKKMNIFNIEIGSFFNIYGLIQKLNLKQLNLKIISKKSQYKLGFKINTKDMSKIDAQIRKELLKLQIRNQINITYKNNSFIVIKQNNNLYKIVQSNDLTNRLLFQQCFFQQDIYLEILDANDEIISIGKFKFYELKKRGQIKVILQNSYKQINKYTFLTLKYERIDIEQDSVNSLFTFGYLFSSRNFNNNQYQIIIENQKARKKTLKKKILAEKNTEKFCELDFLVLNQTQQSQTQIEIRKKHYDDFTESNIYKTYVKKTIFVNKIGKIGDDVISLKISGNSFQMIQFNFYDEEINQELVFKLQISHKKEQFLDKKNSYYLMKIPMPIWHHIKTNFKNYTEVKFQIINSKKSNRDKKHNLNFLNQSEFRLKLADYRDALSITIGDALTYSKIYDLIKIKASQLDNQIIFNNESEWMLSILNIGDQNIQFLFKFQQTEQQEVKTERTISKDKIEIQTQNTKKQKVDDFNKTTRNQDIIQIKKSINNITLQNRTLVTKVVRLENNNTMLKQKLQELKEIASRQKLQLRNQKQGNLKKIVDPAIIQARQKMKKLYRSVCVCGQKNPKFMGYCENCVKKLQNEYRLIYKQFQQKAKLYESTYYKGILKKEKIVKLENKIVSIKNKLLMKKAEFQQQEQQQSNLAQKNTQNLRQKISQIKNAIFTFKLKTKNLIESGNILQMNLETKINDSTKQIFCLMQQIQQCKHRRLQFQQQLKQIYKS